MQGIFRSSCEGRGSCHEDLIASHGIYSRLHRAQFGACPSHTLLNQEETNMLTSKYRVILTMLILCSFLISACGGKGNPTGNAGTTGEIAASGDKPQTKVSVQPATRKVDTIHGKSNIRQNRSELLSMPICQPCCCSERSR